MGWQEKSDGDIGKNRESSLSLAMNFECFYYVVSLIGSAEYLAQDVCDKEEVSKNHLTQESWHSLALMASLTWLNIETHWVQQSWVEMPTS